MSLSYGSLFSGCGLMDLAFHRSGFRCEWQVEIDPQRRRVLAHHWPDVPKYEDVCEVGKRNLSKVDVICGGFPCQGASVAGKRGGLADTRTGLFFEYARIVDELRPSWVVMENVPGLLTCNGGKDFATVLNTLGTLRYIVDVNILDAQYFGVPQRRRRVFFVCQSLESFQRKRSDSSVQTILQCLADMLRSILAFHSSCFQKSPQNSASRDHYVAGLLKRMRLFDLPTSIPRCAKWLTNSEGDCRKSAREREKLASENRGGVGDTGSPTVFAGISSATLKKVRMGNIGVSSSTELSWNDILEELCDVANEFIISTETSKITKSTIYTCAVALLRIALLTFQSNASCQTYSEAESSVLTGLKEFTSYARQSSEDLFGEWKLVRPWRNFIRSSERLQVARGHSGASRAAEILSLRSRRRGHFEACETQGEDVASTLGGGAGKRDDTDRATFVAGPVMASDGGISSADRQASRGAPGTGIGEEGDPCPSLAASHTPAVAFNYQSGGSQDFLGISEQATSALGTTQTPAVVFQERGREGGRNLELQEDLAYSLNAPKNGGRRQEMNIATGMAVRRLMPIECLRLQGAPDDYLDLDPPLSDSAKYAMIGDGVTVPCVEWIAKRLKVVAENELNAIS